MVGRKRVIAVTLFVLAAFLLNWLPPMGQPEDVSGSVRLVDGDSLYVGGREVRMVGIDAPEGRQDCTRGGRSWPCGREARKRLARRIGGRQVRCDVEERDKYDRLLATCFVGDSNLNKWMVQNGWAVSYGRYRSEEKRAARDRLGIWSGTFERPRAWRDKNMRR